MFGQHHLAILVQHCIGIAVYQFLQFKLNLFPTVQRQVKLYTTARNHVGWALISSAHPV